MIFYFFLISVKYHFFRAFLVDYLSNISPLVFVLFEVYGYSSKFSFSSIYLIKGFYFHFSIIFFLKRYPFNSYNNCKNHMRVFSDTQLEKESIEQVPLIIPISRIQFEKEKNGETKNPELIIRFKKEKKNSLKKKENGKCPTCGCGLGTKQILRKGVHKTNHMDSHINTIILFLFIFLLSLSISLSLSTTIYSTALCIFFLHYH